MDGDASGTKDNKGIYQRLHLKQQVQSWSMFEARFQKRGRWPQTSRCYKHWQMTCFQFWDLIMTGLPAKELLGRRRQQHWYCNCLFALLRWPEPTDTCVWDNVGNSGIAVQTHENSDHSARANKFCRQTSPRKLQGWFARITMITYTDSIQASYGEAL